MLYGIYLCGYYSLSPVFSMHGVAVYSANMAKLPRSKASLHSRAAREVEHSSGALPTTPHTTDAAHFPGCHQKVRLVLFLRS